MTMERAKQILDVFAMPVGEARELAKRDAKITAREAFTLIKAKQATMDHHLSRVRPSTRCDCGNRGHLSHSWKNDMCPRTHHLRYAPWAFEVEDL